jgi:hypothetical protein
MPLGGYFKDRKPLLEEHPKLAWLLTWSHYLRYWVVLGDKQTLVASYRPEGKGCLGLPLGLSCSLLSKVF